MRPHLPQSGFRDTPCPSAARLMVAAAARRQGTSPVTARLVGRPRGRAFRGVAAPGRSTLPALTITHLMGIDIYAYWDGMTDAEEAAQITGMSVVRGHVGYLREAYHGEPHATRVLVP